ncbi:MAG: hypothetical protein RML14_10635 [Meiothermus sp.]|uniref:hypothetical protein n=1 Tax=Meiothermus sp. TaxID=1955249 RepID=UPI00298F1079|nr:hypothetical protein [Meiothermus sp.]MDW8482299.1 hypothetical protein [Meiothermus sp.]
MKLRELEVWEMEEVSGGGWMYTVNPETGDRYTWFETPEGVRSSVRVESDAYKGPEHTIGSVSCCGGNFGPVNVDFPVFKFEIKIVSSDYFISYEQMGQNLYRAGERINSRTLKGLITNLLGP